MKGKFSVLQIGTHNDNESFQYDPRIKWYFIHESMLIHDITEQLNLYLKEIKAFDLVIVETHMSTGLEQLLIKVMSPYNTIVDQQFFHPCYEEMPYQQFIVKKFTYQSATERLDKLKTITFSGQYGDKLIPARAVVNPLYEGTIRYIGNKYLVLEDLSKEAFEQILTWKFNVYYEKQKLITLWLEFIKYGDIELMFKFRVLDRHTHEILETFEVSGDAINKPIEIARRDNDANVTVSLFAKGRGTLHIGALHRRWSRHEFGEFIMGGKRYSDHLRDEFIYYFDPGDMKPPLNVYFSGYRSAEGFEGYFMMKKMGAPFILIGDPRIEGGAFYLGSDEYEQAIADCITNALKQLGFAFDELILSGLSMGSFGALYYGAKLLPQAVIVGKPLVNIGTVAENIRLLRPEEFGTSLDVLLTNTGQVNRDAVMQLNHKFWNIFEQVDISNITFGVSYMQDDDYDLYAYDHLLEVLSKRHAKVMGRGIPGRHNDDSLTIANWFLNFYAMILREKFGRDA
ncbi:accessory Sec system protein Asp2 [Macrococcoides caseolyticum]|uniref:accessory Sec system protein Asp2 n=1 Tax=Macrococcoides caseolyticum TaxID=69966 RepID=UPI001F342A76|nr:accessory Sec system protein Asp2 [Macrococcus caseolyticus]MCE4957552.1 accessory Sec system protein Asp2 [Macrococcus caseolyticus]